MTRENEPESRTRVLEHVAPEGHPSVEALDDLLKFLAALHDAEQIDFSDSDREKRLRSFRVIDRLSELIARARKTPLEDEDSNAVELQWGWLSARERVRSLPQPIRERLILKLYGGYGKLNMQELVRLYSRSLDNFTTRLFPRPLERYRGSRNWQMAGDAELSASMILLVDSLIGAIASVNDKLRSELTDLCEKIEKMNSRLEHNELRNVSEDVT